MEACVFCTFVVTREIKKAVNWGDPQHTRSTVKSVFLLA